MKKRKWKFRIAGGAVTLLGIYLMAVGYGETITLTIATVVLIFGIAIWSMATPEACMHTFSGCSAAVCCYHTAVLIFIEHNAEVFQPGDCIRSFHYELAKQFRSCSKMSAAECIKIMLCRGVILFVCCLDTTFCRILGESVPYLDLDSKKGFFRRVFGR